MTLRELKKWVNKIPEADLDKEIHYNSEEYGVSGYIHGIVKSRVNLYWDNEEWSPLKTKKQFKEDEGYTEEDFEGMSIEIAKGDYYVKID